MTLLEVLVALSILAISFVLLIRAHIQSYTIVAQSDELNRATLLVESVCARLDAFGWTDISSRQGLDEGPPRLFYRVWIKGSPIPRVKQVVIKIFRSKQERPLITLTRWMISP